MSAGSAGEEFKPVQRSGTSPLSLNAGRPLPVARPFLLDETKKQLQAVGYIDGDPLPPNLAEKLTQMREEVASTRKAEVAAGIADLPNTMAGYKSPVMGPPVDITSLPQEKQNEIREWLQGFKADVETIQSAPQNTTEPRPASQPQPQAPEPAASETVATPGQQLEQLLPVNLQCKRCGWPTDQPFEVAPTEDDKSRFVISVLGGTSFQKEYELFAGKATLRLRSLTVAEVTAINMQLGYMVRNGIITGQLEYALHNMLFRTSLGVEFLGVGAVIIFQLPPEIVVAAIRKPTPEDAESVGHPTRLSTYMKEFTDALKTETTVRIVSSTYRNFQRLIELLEAMTDSENFWKGIS